MMDQPSKLRPTIQSDAPSEERPVGEIVSELWHNTEKLARQELQLGLAHLEQKTEALKTELKAQAISAAISGGLLLAGLLTIVAAIVMALSKVIDPWLSALIVGLAVSGVGYALLPRSKVAHAAAEAANSLSGLKSSHTFKET